MSTTSTLVPVYDSPEAVPEETDGGRDSYIYVWYGPAHDRGVQDYETRVTAWLAGYGDRTITVTSDGSRGDAGDRPVQMAIERAQRWIAETPQDYQVGYEAGRRYAQTGGSSGAAYLTDDEIVGKVGPRAARVDGFRDGADGAERRLTTGRVPA